MGVLAAEYLTTAKFEDLLRSRAATLEARGRFLTEGFVRRVEKGPPRA